MNALWSRRLQTAGLHFEWIRPNHIVLRSSVRGGRRHHRHSDVVEELLTMMGTVVREISSFLFSSVMEKRSVLQQSPLVASKGKEGI